MRIIVDTEQADRVLLPLLERFYTKRFPYNLAEAQPPQQPENLPRNGFVSPLDYAYFLLTACLFMRGKIRSDTAMRCLSKIYEECPEVFRPEVAKTLDREWLDRRLQAVGLGFSSWQNARFWIENLRQVEERWGGDPRNILDDVETFEESCQRLCNQRSNRGKASRKGKKSPHPGFFGFQEKMASMITYYFNDAGFIKDPFHYPLPVDFHVLRIILAHQIIRLEGTNGNLHHHFEPLLAAIRDLSVSFSLKHGTDPLHMSEFIWYFSRSMCKRYPGNMSTYKGPRKGRQTVISPKKLTWIKSQIRSYNLSCGQCPVRTTCTYAIPAGPYSNHGRIILRARPEPPQLRLLEPVQEIVWQKRRWKKAMEHEPEALSEAPEEDKQLGLFTD